MTYPESMRDPLPAGESYPLARATLDAALVKAGVESIDMVYFLRAGIDSFDAPTSAAVLRIDFRAPTRDWAERLELRIHAVRASQRRAIESALSTDILARIAVWVRNAEMSENVWRSSDHALIALWDGKVLQLVERVGKACAEPLSW